MTNTDEKNFNATIGNTVLCDGFLIPMTDFVNNIGNMENYPSHENALSWIYNYATFLRQPLKLEMFVPCDEDGNIWQYPPTKEEWEWAQKDSAHGEQSFKQKEYYYEKAKEKILFELKMDSDYNFGISDYKFICNYYVNLENWLKGKDVLYKIKLSQTALDSIFGETVA